MPKRLLQFVALLLLVVQGMVASASASVRVLCLPTLHCESHPEAPPPEAPETPVATCRHNAVKTHGADDPVVPRGGGHEHRLFDMTAHAEEPCGCYVHVPAPGNEQPTSHVQSRSDHPDLRVLTPPVLVIAFLQWDLGPSRAAPLLVDPPTFRMSDQILALEATRLLI